jgi:hypothetical protein
MASTGRALSACRVTSGDIHDRLDLEIGEMGALVRDSRSR